MKSTVLDLKTVGTLSPASSFTAKRVGNALPPNAKTVLELGAGDGAITRTLLERLSPDARLLAVEMKPEFAAVLEAIGDARLSVYTGDALQIKNEAASRGFVSFDVIVSSLPFALFPEAARDSLLNDIFDLLAPGGVIIVCQHMPTLLPALKEKYHIDIQVEPLNMPPYFILRGTKR